ncbi:pepsin/retropepsin-like aspartic protease family protein [Kordiimonas sp. SCSIO 12610]|uniref:pepsin/retropepsin-like aspartic protease family protein n=1 Tax=Kordiimonas sp. SCSIO 12610 TaxID=2829597 RepID=UPI002108A099|nr:pepsin/retropepsin-like aspartic protease family protein [Kordiimonas sp. SCSIO 12610]UTW56118.1 aspartyl protease family protein [Kordiimonas sp. SCSIO 12610]
MTFKVIVSLMWVAVVSSGINSIQALSDDKARLSATVDPQVRALLLGRNAFKLQQYVKSLTPEDKSLTAVLARAQVAVLAYDFEHASSLLSQAELTLSGTGDERLKAHVVSLQYLNFAAQGDYQGYLNYAADQPSFLPPAFVRELERRVKKGRVQTIKPKTSTYLENKTPKGPYMLFDGVINGNNASVLIDTGSDQTVLSRGHAEKFGLSPVGEAQVQGPSAEFRNFGFSQLESITLGNVEQINIPVTVPIAKALDQRVAQTSDIILGFQETYRLGGVKIDADGHTIKGFERFNPAVSNKSPLDTNLLIYNHKPLVKVHIEGDVYSCLIDTGASSSFVSEDIFKKYKKTLKLKSGKKTRAQLLGEASAQKLKTIKELPLTVNGTPIILKRVARRKNSDTDYCFLGNDTIKAAGGLTFDFVNMQAKFGPIN